jgi:hypothetical protein
MVPRLGGGEFSACLGPAVLPSFKLPLEEFREFGVGDRLKLCFEGSPYVLAPGLESGIVNPIRVAIQIGSNFLPSSSLFHRFLHLYGPYCRNNL